MTLLLQRLCPSVLLLVFVGLLFRAAPAAAQPLLVPEFVAEERQDLALAYLLYDQAVQQLRDGGYEVIDGEVLRERQGADAEECAFNRACPGVLFARWRVDLALVGDVRYTGGNLMLRVGIFHRDSERPLEVFDEVVAQGREQAVVALLVRRVDVHARGGGGSASSAAADRAREAELMRLEEQRLAEEARRAEEERRYEEDAAARRAEEERLRREEEERAEVERRWQEEQARIAEERRREEEEEERRRMDALTALDDEDEEEPDVRSESSSRESRDREEAEEADRSEMARAREIDKAERLAAREADAESRERTRSAAEDDEDRYSRHRQVYIEVQGGYGLGDTDRTYDVRVALDADTLESTDVDEYDALSRAAGGTGGIAVGYTPLPFLEAGVFLGLQGGRKYLSAGWATFDETIQVEEDVEVFDPVSAWQFVAEPRVRVLALPRFIVKPYGLVGLNFRVFDSYAVPDLTTVDYPNRPGLARVGATVGAGVGIDPNQRFGAFVEAPFVFQLTGREPYSVESSLFSAEDPSGGYPAGWLFRVVGGAALRF